MLRGRDRLLLILAAMEDFFQEVVSVGGLAGFSYKQLYGFTPRKFKRQNFYMAVKRALEAGDIEKVIKKGKPYLRIVGKGRRRLIRDFPLFSLQKEKWDKRWRLVFFDIEEVNRNVRDKFRRKLGQLGFGQFQRSVYISPFPIEKEMQEFIKSLNLEEKAYLLVTQRLFVGNERLLAEKVWHLHKINEDYREILEQLGEKIDEAKKREIRARYLEVLLSDPCLPYELMPEDWLAEKVRKKIFDLGS